MRLHDRGLAEEFVQEAFLRAMAHEMQLSLMEWPQRRAWMCRAVKNLFLDRRRRDRRLSSLEGMEDEGFDIASDELRFADVEWETLLGSLPVRRACSSR